MKRLLVGLLMMAVGCSQAGSRNGSVNDDGIKPNNVAKGVSEAPPALIVGSQAPPLKVSRFLKGEPITSFESGKIYVIEFWATWCGPCVAAMPHVSELQKQYPAVTFVGVNVWDEEESAAEEFLKANDKRISYRIARDEIPQGGKADDGVMSQTWLHAAEAGGIPTAFVVNGEGKIALITHPMDLEESLPQIIKGKWDLQKAAKKHLDEIMEERRSASLQERLRELITKGPTVEAIAGLDKLASENPSSALRIELAKFQLLSFSEEMADVALEEGRKLIEGPLAKDPEMLNAIAWELVDPERKPVAPAALQALALDAARRADAVSEKKNMAIVDTLARALFCSGDIKAATETQRRAISLAQSSDEPVEADVLNELKRRLREYEQASPIAKGAAGKSE